MHREGEAPAEPDTCTLRLVWAAHRAVRPPGWQVEKRAEEPQIIVIRTRRPYSLTEEREESVDANRRRERATNTGDALVKPAVAAE
jgi:hypothetical protein